MITTIDFVLSKMESFWRISATLLYDPTLLLLCSFKCCRKRRKETVRSVLLVREVGSLSRVVTKAVRRGWFGDVFFRPAGGLDMEERGDLRTVVPRVG